METTANVKQLFVQKASPATRLRNSIRRRLRQKDAWLGLLFLSPSLGLFTIFAEYLNNGNGRSGLATESLVNSEAGVKTLTWWKEMVDNKTAANLGRKTDDTKKAFAAGQIAMTLDSTASLRGIVNSAAGKFEVGTAFLPQAPGSKDGGVIVGGASLYILNNKSDAEQNAAWEFIKFLASPEVQAQWSIDTGYFPITKKAYDQQIVKDNMIKYPQFKTAVDQLHATKANTATQGAVMGIFPEARQLVEGPLKKH